MLVKANLSEANLSGANLSGAKLTAADLAGANLNKANFSGADLIEANLEEADLSGADLSGADLAGARFKEPMNFNGANLSGANLQDAFLYKAILSNANLSRANLINADLRIADLTNANLTDANLSYSRCESANMNKANLSNANLINSNLDNANLSGANLTNANLTRANLVETNFSQATISGSMIYGISAWNLNLENTTQKDLVISKDDEPVMSVDNLAVAQFIYLMINNKNIRDVLNTVTSKGVLILGRFSDPQRKSVLDGLREKLRQFDLLPIVFDFDRPTDKDYTETVQTLAGMSMFVIADLTSPKSTPMELEATVKQFKIPYVPIIDISIDPRPFAMLTDLKNSFHWVLDVLGYKTKEQLLQNSVIKKYIIDPVNKKRAELRDNKNNDQGIIIITEIDAESPSE